MTPQLQQAIKLLELGRLEYIEAIQKELLENPVLEELASEDSHAAPDRSNSSSESPDNPTPQPEASQAETIQPETMQAESMIQPPSKDAKDQDWAEYLERFTDSRGTATPKGLIDHSERPSVENVGSSGTNLAEHLLFQVRMSDLAEEDLDMALHIIGNLNKDGYLDLSYEEIAQITDRTLADVERVIDAFRYLDPCGVAARDLRECLLIQLEAGGLTNALPWRIVKDHLTQLERRNWEQIAKAEKVDVEQVYAAVKVIRSLEPRPGRPFGDETANYIVPDIYVYKVGDEYVISQNDDGLPKLRVSPYYVEILKNRQGGNKENTEYLNDRLKAAQFLIKSIHRRQRTIYKVTESIVKFQREFLDEGITRLKPLVLKDVADDIGMHESTVSRVTTNKFVHTPQGVFELKFFFTTGIKSGNSSISSSAVKERIRTIIGAEDPDNPVSDQTIVNMLQEEGVEIARRTVAKYRESLGIASSSKRKKLF